MSDYWEQRKRKERREDTLITILAFLVGIGLMAAGIIGVVTSLMQAEDYENTPDIRTVDAVIESIETKNKKNDNGSLYERHYKLKISYEVDGKTYNGRKDLYAYGNMVDSKREKNTISSKEASLFRSRFIRTGMEITSWQISPLLLSFWYTAR